MDDSGLDEPREAGNEQAVERVCRDAADHWPVDQGDGGREEQGAGKWFIPDARPRLTPPRQSRSSSEINYCLVSSKDGKSMYLEVG